MKRNWELEELIDCFTFLPNELKEISNKSGKTRIGFAIMFKFFQNEVRFPNYKSEIPKAVIEYIGKQIDTSPELFEQYDFEGRAFYYHKSQIRNYFGFREATTEDSVVVRDWLSQQISPDEIEIEHLKTKVYNKLRKLKIEPPTIDRVERITRSALNVFEEQFFKEIFSKIPTLTKARIDNLISESIENEISETEEFMSFSYIRNDPGRIGLESALNEIT